MRKIYYLLALTAFVVCQAGATVLEHSPELHAFIGYDDEDDEDDEDSSRTRRQGTRSTWGRDTTRGKEIPLPMGIFQWKVDPKLGTVIPAENTDTAVHNFQNWKMQDGMTGDYSHTGNTGSARLSRIFIDRKKEDDFFFLSPLNYFRGGVSNFLFTNTKSPITNLAYHSCGDKQDGEDRVRGNFATNINKNSGVGFILDYNYARGYYTNQQVSQFGGTVYGYYRGERYQMHAYINANHIKNAENGGIADDNYIRQPWMYQKKFGSKDIPVNISDSWNKNDDETYFLSHRYNLGYDREIVVPDSLKPIPPSDAELIMTLADSIRLSLAEDSVARKLVADSLRTKWVNELVPPTEFVSVASIIHTFEVKHLNHTFYDQGSNADFYTYHYWGQGSDIEDRADITSYRNTIGLSMNEGFRKWVKMGLAFFATHKYLKFTQPMLVNDQLVTDSEGEHEVSIGARIRRDNSKVLRFNVDGELSLIGHDAGSFEIEAEGELDLKLGKRDTASLLIMAEISNTKPSHTLSNYRNAYVQLEGEDFPHEFRTSILGELAYNRTNTRIRLGWNNLTNYTYLAMRNTLKSESNSGSILPSHYTHSVKLLQAPSSIEVFTISLLQDLKWKFIGWENAITYQHSTNADALPLPTLNIYTNLYLQFRIAKVLRVQIGGDMRFFTRYYAPDYFGALGMFAVQDPDCPRVKMGGYPIVNVYANFHLKHARFYVNVAHVNAGSGNMFLAPHYPINPLTVNFGLSWNFFN